MRKQSFRNTKQLFNRLHSTEFWLSNRHCFSKGTGIFKRVSEYVSGVEHAETKPVKFSRRIHRSMLRG